LQAIKGLEDLKDLKDKNKKVVSEVNQHLDNSSKLLQLCLDTIHQLELEKSQQIKSVELLQHHIQKLELELRNQAEINQI
jgi:hypothetical protein